MTKLFPLSFSQSISTGSTQRGDRILEMNGTKWNTGTWKNVLACQFNLLLSWGFLYCNKANQNPCLSDRPFPPTHTPPVESLRIYLVAPAVFPNDKLENKRKRGSLIQQINSVTEVLDSVLALRGLEEGKVIFLLSL